MNPSTSDNQSDGLPPPVPQDGQDSVALPSVPAMPPVIDASSPQIGATPHSASSTNDNGNQQHSNISTNLSQHSPAIADDADLIEKEWVTKAKAIVAQTKDNPNEQSREINKFKADYLKKRYNKDLKVNES